MLITMIRSNRLLTSSCLYRSSIRKITNGGNSEVLFESSGASRIITLNRPKALNALNLNMVRQIYPQLKQWQEDSNVGLVVIKGCNERAFCAGGDVLHVTNLAKSGDKSYHEFFYEEYQLNHLIGTYKHPYIAIIDGITMGGGCGLSIHGSHRVATERTLLAMPETALGLFPDVGGSYFLPKLNGNLGIYLGLTGYRLKGADVYHSGLATNYVEANSLIELENALKNMSKSECNKQKVNETIKKFQPSSIPEFSLKPYLNLINKAFNGNSVEEILKNLENEGSEFSKKQIDIINKMSPTSLKVTFEQIKRGKDMTYPDIFKMEARIVSHCFKGHDFFEGCRAILIDKDRNPKWNPSKLSDVTPEMVNKYFEKSTDFADLEIN